MASEKAERLKGRAAALKHLNLLVEEVKKASNEIKGYLENGEYLNASNISKKLDKQLGVLKSKATELRGAELITRENNKRIFNLIKTGRKLAKQARQARRASKKGSKKLPKIVKKAENEAEAVEDKAEDIDWDEEDVEWD